MSWVKPPKLKDLLEAYGSLKKVVEHLSQSGFTAEEMARKYGIPFHLVKLCLANVEPRGAPLFFTVTDIYDRIASFRSPKGKETELVKLFKIEGIDLELKVRLAMGSLLDVNVGVGPAMVENAIATAARVSSSKVRNLFRDYGDYGDVASMLISEKRPILSVDEVYRTMKLLVHVKGTREKLLTISSLLRSSTPVEAKYIVRMLLRDLKLGYHDSTIMAAASRALGVRLDLLTKAVSTIGLFDGLMRARLGNEGLAAVKLRPGAFIPPQLAHLYEPDKVQFPVLVERKFDGSRLQLHKWGTSVWLFSRRAVEKSETLPEIANIVRNFNAHSCIVDSEVVPIDERGRYLKFQDLLHRTAPRKFEEKRAKEVHLTIRAFDLLYWNGRDLRDFPLMKRREYLRAIVPLGYISEGELCNNDLELMIAYDKVLKEGFEGVVIKSLDSPYETGRRTHTWLKYKQERDSLDCVMVKALFGRGRRAGYFSSFELAIRDPVKKKLYTVGRVSNLPDHVMARIRDVIEMTKVSEDKEGVYVQPSMVLEVTFQEIQETDEYSSGYALRVPKVVRVREDKGVEDIDTLEKLQKLYNIQYEERYRVKGLP